jgi:general secretion pathway protein F
MPQFRYRAVTGNGELVEGTMAAASREAVISHLQVTGHVPVRAEEVGSRGSSRWIGARPLARRLSSQALALLIRELATLLHAGMPIDRAIHILTDLVTRPEEAECLRKLRSGIENGQGLADAMSAQPGIFPEFCISMVRAGEAGASLEITLERIADFLEQSHATREEIKNACMYPMIVFGTCCLSLLVLFGLVVPRFRSIFEQSAGQLPLVTQVVLAISDVLENYWWALLAVVVGLAATIYLQLSRRDSKERWLGRLLTFPVIGDILRKTETARFCRTLGTLLKNDVPLLAALHISRATVQSRVMIEALSDVIESARAGKGLADPLTRSQAFPPLAVHFIRVGEETAKHDDMLLRVAEIFDRETQRSVQRLLTLLGPSLTLGMGVIVLVVIGSILAAVLSIYDLAS